MSQEKKSRQLRRSQQREPVASDSQFQLVSVIIPAKDAANSIGSLIPKVKESLLGYAHEVIVVDDGSIDETREIARRNGAIVISHDKNLGKGAAMKTGVENAGGDVIVFLDGDGAHQPQDISRVIAPLLARKANLVIGSRALPESKVSTYPVRRRLSNDLASLVISVVISFLLPLVTMFRHPVKWVRISDCTSGFRAITKEGWQKLDLTSQGFQIETEMIYEAAKNKLAIAEAPISCNWDSQLSRLSIVRDGWMTSKLLASKLMSELGGKVIYLRTLRQNKE